MLGDLLEPRGPFLLQNRRVWALHTGHLIRPPNWSREEGTPGMAFGLPWPPVLAQSQPTYISKREGGGPSCGPPAANPWQPCWRGDLPPLLLGSAAPPCLSAQLEKHFKEPRPGNSTETVPCSQSEIAGWTSHPREMKALVWVGLVPGRLWPSGGICPIRVDAHPLRFR